MRPKAEEIRSIFSEKSRCPYYNDGRMSHIEYFFPKDQETGDYHKYLERGYRRYGSIFYRNICDGCHSCLPLRLETMRFNPGKSQRRTLRKNLDLQIRVLSGTFITEDKISLFRKYMESKHDDYFSEGKSDALDSLANIHYGYDSVIEMDYYLEDRLVGVGIVDEARDSLSSNYFYYDTGLLNRRLGVLSILKEITLAGLMGKKYYYLGFYIEDNSKMSYKIQFRPNEIYEKGRWAPFLSD